MDEMKLSFDEMISRLDTACGMLLVPSMASETVREAMKIATSVSLSLGEWAQEYEQNEWRGQPQEGEGK